MTEFLLEEAIRQNVTGDLIETGVWRGGAAIFGAAVFKAYGQSSRRVWAADSFKGVPPVDVTRFPVERAHAGVVEPWRSTHSDNSAQRVQLSFAHFGLLTPTVKILEGWFNETLPRNRCDFTSFAVIRPDGDTFQSTYQALENLYDKLSIGGFVIVDDYTDWVGCHQAIHSFRRNVGILDEVEPLKPVYHARGRGEAVRGVWWQKKTEVGPFPDDCENLRF